MRLMRDLLASLTDQVPNVAVVPCTAALFSSAVPPKRLLALNFGRSGRTKIWANRPLESRMRIPFGLGPKTCRLVPSGATLSLETIAHVPLSCSLSDFCWARALPGSKASPNVVITERLKM